MCDLLTDRLPMSKDGQLYTVYDMAMGTSQMLTCMEERMSALDKAAKLICYAREHGAGHNYLIQHSAGSGKSNSIAWTAYRMASLHDADNEPVFTSVIIVIDRRVLDQQLQATVSSFDHTLGTVVTIGNSMGKQTHNKV